jgi:hypothetical protein
MLLLLPLVLSAKCLRRLLKFLPLLVPLACGFLVQLAQTLFLSFRSLLGRSQELLSLGFPFLGSLTVCVGKLLRCLAVGVGETLRLALPPGFELLLLLLMRIDQSLLVLEMGCFGSFVRGALFFLCMTSYKTM